jgi:hypothetical protein
MPPRATTPQSTGSLASGYKVGSNRISRISGLSSAKRCRRFSRNSWTRRGLWRADGRRNHLAPRSPDSPKDCLLYGRRPRETVTIELSRLSREGPLRVDEGGSLCFWTSSSRLRLLTPSGTLLLALPHRGILDASGAGRSYSGQSGAEVRASQLSRRMPGTITSGGCRVGLGGSSPSPRIAA